MIGDCLKLSSWTSSKLFDHLRHFFFFNSNNGDGFFYPEWKAMDLSLPIVAMFPGRNSGLSPDKLFLAKKWEKFPKNFTYSCFRHAKNYWIAVSRTPIELILEKKTNFSCWMLVGNIAFKTHVHQSFGRRVFVCIGVDAMQIYLWANVETVF